jgi:hypothetical protein
LLYKQSNFAIQTKQLCYTNKATLLYKQSNFAIQTKHKWESLNQPFVKTFGHCNWLAIACQCMEKKFSLVVEVVVAVISWVIGNNIS